MRSALEGLEGVENAEVSLDKDNAVVVFDSSKVTIKQMTESVKKAGYGISGASEITQYKKGKSEKSEENKSDDHTTDYRTLTIEELAELTDDPEVTLVNVHIPYAGEIPGTNAFVPFNRIQENKDKLPSDKNAKIFLYCRSGHMSKLASNTLTGMGYTDVYDVPGGMNAWRKAGYEISNTSQ
ncbi:MAG: cation transporter [Candidatus Marinimicrobia bacterium]|nr:cation transporter [Candidatus Neomarinimicrobiota bacterium]MCF7830343.1 cation transporter [Candidatus Neomarinimicrobiota bacterium]MCF7882411.1 cation transporter [Candidatus Neomarinimicrobiota bacterium]